ncbi:hypothetical protein FRC17_011139, partial [Serendipita sp. 399]
MIRPLYKLKTERHLSHVRKTDTYLRVMAKLGLQQSPEASTMRYLVSKKRLRSLENGINIKSVRWGNISAWKPYRGASLQIARPGLTYSAVLKDVEEAASFEFDYVFVCTKVIPELKRITDILAPLFAKGHSPKTKYVLLQNGLGIETDLYLVLSSLPTSQNGIPPPTTPTIIYCAMALFFMWLLVVLGLYRPESHSSPSVGYIQGAGDHDAADLLLEILNKSGFEASKADDIAAAKFYKPLTPSQWAQCPKSSHFAYQMVRKMLEEMVRIGRELGYGDSYLPASVVDEKISGEMSRATESVESSRFVASALLDVLNDRPFELEVILGEVLRMGKQHKCDVTCIEIVYNLLADACPDICDTLDMEIEVDNGGGSRCASQLKILDTIMYRIQYDEYPNDPDKVILPCDYFDLCGGSDAGGIIVMMLVKLRMSVEETSIEFDKICEQVYEPKDLSATERTTRLRSLVEDLLARKHIPLDAKLLDGADDPGGCAGFVIARPRLNVQGIATFRTYRTRAERPMPITIVDAVLATCAAQPAFLPVTIGTEDRKMDYIGAILGASNPIRELISEAHALFGGSAS